MSLDFDLMGRACIFSRNITHNLTKMADAAGIYDALWNPEMKGYKFASDIIPILRKGLEDLRSRPEYFSKFNASNGWGKYEHFVPFVEEVLAACEANPGAEIEVSV